VQWYQSWDVGLILSFGSSSAKELYHESVPIPHAFLRACGQRRMKLAWHIFQGKVSTSRTGKFKCRRYKRASLIANGPVIYSLFPPHSLTPPPVNHHPDSIGMGNRLVVRAPEFESPLSPPLPLPLVKSIKRRGIGHFRWGRRQSTLPPSTPLPRVV